MTPFLRLLQRGSSRWISTPACAASWAVILVLVGVGDPADIGHVAGQTPPKTPLKRIEPAYLSSDLQLLKTFGLATGSDGAVEYLRELQPSPETVNQVGRMIQELGHPEYQRREQATKKLIRMPALPIQELTKAAESQDAEIRWRAGAILRQSENQSRQLLLAAFRVLQHHPQENCTADLFATLPLCRETSLVRAVHQAIQACVTEKDVPLLRKHLESESAPLRVAAVFGWLALKQPTQAVYPLLEDPREPVIVQTARALADLGDRRCLAALAGLLDSNDAQIRTQAIVILRSLTSCYFGFAAYDPPSQRTAATAAWKKWVKEEGAEARLRFPLQPRRLARGDLNGNTLMSLGSMGRVIEVDPSGKTVWSFALAAWSAEKLLNGNVLIASYSAKKIVEVDRKGKVVWQHTGVSAMTAKPLPNGRILVADFQRRRVIEIDRKRQIVWEHKTPASCFDADRLPNGNTIFGCPNLICEVTPSGETVRSWPVEGRLNGFQVLDNGNLLVANYGKNQVYELTPENKIVWTFSERQPCDVFRLPDGKTLVATAQRIIEIGADRRSVRELSKARYGSARR